VDGEFPRYDLECVEEEGGALEVDLVGGDAAGEFAHGALDVGVAGGRRDSEGLAGGAAGATLVRVANGGAGGVVVEAEGLAARGR
jgi:hypothetical protein